MHLYKVLRCLVLFVAILEPGLSDAADTTVSSTPLAKRFDKLAPHPRLYVSVSQLERMVNGRGEDYADAYEKIEAVAETAIRDTDNPMEGISVWSRGVLIQGRLLALAIQWHRTEDRRYLEAALATMDVMKAWMKPNMITLAEGQFIAGFAIAYDLLYNDLTDDERAQMVALARDYYLKPFLNVTGPSDPETRREGEHRTWWVGQLSNWNPVSITGGGLLALTMYEDLDDAQLALDRVNASYQPIFDYLQKTEGGWMEGLGYWNWTIHYMSLFGISYERATGEKHVAFRSPGFKQTLGFGTYFVPHGEPCGFGDNNHGGFSDSLLAAAEHLGYTEVLRRLQDHRLRMRASADLKEDKRAANNPEKVEEVTEQQPDDHKLVNTGYGTPQRLLIEPDLLEGDLARQDDMVKHYPTQGWGMLADQWPDPSIYAIVRGGEQGGAHTHNDLLSWQAVVGIEKMIHECGDGRSSSAAFGPRDKDIFERTSLAKNTLFIGGIPPNRARNGTPHVETTTFQLPTGPAIRLEATKAFYLGGGNPRIVARFFAVIDDRGLLVIDRVIGRKGNPVEVRTYTRKEAIFGERDVLLKGEFETARMTFAADAPEMVLRRASALTTLGSDKPPTMMRWQTLDKVKDVTIASLLTRGEDPVDLQVQSDDTAVTVTMGGSDWSKTIRLTTDLKAISTVE